MFAVTMLSTFVGRFIFGVSIFCSISVGAIAPGTSAEPPAQPQTQTVAIEPAQTMTALLPLNARWLEIEAQPVGFSQVADRLNTQMAVDRAIASEPIGLQLDSIPVISEFVDESGNVEMGKGLPFSIGVGDVMGNTGLVLSTDFTTH